MRAHLGASPTSPPNAHVAYHPGAKPLHEEARILRLVVETFGRFIWHGLYVHRRRRSNPKPRTENANKT